MCARDREPKSAFLFCERNDACMRTHIYVCVCVLRTCVADEVQIDVGLFRGEMLREFFYLGRGDLSSGE